MTVSTQQHVELFRKRRLRARLLDQLGLDSGPAYVPFIGDGDLAESLYDRFAIFGADLDPDRVEVARSRLPNAVEVIEADCDSWPAFERYGGQPLVLADFDAYAYPYDSFRAALASATWAERVAVMFTDAQRQAMMRSGHFRTPAGDKVIVKGTSANVRRPYYNGWFTRYVMPWFVDAIDPYRVKAKAMYQRGMMIYWGAVIEA